MPPMSTPSGLLLVRGADLLVLGVSWSGFAVATLVAGDPGPERLVARADGARTITLFFPPQAIAETKYDSDADVSTAAARLGGASRVAFSVPAGTQVPLTVAGVLGALTGPGAEVVTTGDGLPTAIELPWHLTIAPRARSGAPVTSRHPALPEASATGAVGLWGARLLAADGGDANAGLALLPLANDRDDGGLGIAGQPLSGDQRQMILDAAVPEDVATLAHARRLELGALGGSLSSRLQTADLEWDHDVSLGRDQRVRFAIRGVLYPLGPRAGYVETAERRFLPDGPNPVAGLHRPVELMISEPLRPLTEGEDLLRQFPFSAVEILQRSFTAIQPAVFTSVTRDAKPHGDLQGEIDALAAQRQALVNDVEQRLAALPQTLDAFIEQGFGSSADLQQAQADRASFDPEGLRQAQADADRVLDDLDRQRQPTVGADGELIPVDDGTLAAIQLQVDATLATRPTNQAIEAAFAGQAVAQQQVTALSAAVQSQFEGLARTLDTLAAQGDQAALDAQALTREIESRQAVIAAIAAGEAEQQPIFFVPRDADGNPVRFPLRCAAANGDVALSVPLIFVRDVVLEENEHFPRFASLTDPKVAAALADAWAANASITLPGVPIDLVRDPAAAAPAPGDVHEVHEMTVVAVARDGGFRPVVTGLTVELPALRSLLPGIPTRQPIRFATRFLEEAGIPPVPLQLVNPLDVDFRAVADRAGGLVSPKFIADGISRGDSGRSRPTRWQTRPRASCRSSISSRCTRTRRCSASRSRRWSSCPTPRAPPPTSCPSRRRSSSSSTAACPTA